MKALLLDDPVGSLSFLEEKLTEKGIEVVRVWDVYEAENKFSTDHFDGIIASTISVLGDSFTFCLDAKAKAPSPVMACLCSPYPIEENDANFLRSIGIDIVSPSIKDDNLVTTAIDIMSSGNGRIAKANDEYDRQRVMKIARDSYYTALKDLSSKAIKLEEILENSSDVIYELDPYGRIILISKVIEKLTGYTRSELLGMSALDVVSPDSLDVVSDHISMLLTSQAEPPAVEVGVQSKNGHIIPAEMIVRPIRHKNQVAGILGIGRNVEERKRLEENIRRVINEKDFYLDLMSHDLQNFNTAIVGYIEMILSTEGLDPKIQRYAEGAFRQIMQTAQLIAHLKRVAQIRVSGAKSLSRRDLHQVMQRSLNNIQSKPSFQNMVITLECQDESCPIIAGEDIDDLLEIAVASAARYSLSDLVHLKVIISPEVTQGKKYWSILITGNSLKLSKPIVRCVMSQDFSGCQTIERPDLQLLVLRAIVETQGGTIEAIAQENGRGDQFVIRLPQA